MDLYYWLDPKTALEIAMDAGRHCVKFDPAALTAEQRALLAHYTDSPRSTEAWQRDLGREVLVLGSRQGGHVWGFVTPTQPTIEAVLAACEQQETKHLAEESKRTAAHERDVAKTLEALDKDPTINTLYYGVDTRDPRIDARRAELEPRRLEILRQRAEEEAAKKARFEQAEAARIAEAAEKKARRAAQIATCVRDWGDDDQRQRLADGVLPEAEALELIESHVLAPLAHHAEYERIFFDDLVHDENCSAVEGLSCKRTEVTELSREQYAIFRSLKDSAIAAAAAIDATLTLEKRRHHCACDYCHHYLVRLGVLVHVEWGALSVSREYGLP